MMGETQENKVAQGRTKSKIDDRILARRGDG
jgi:hypothetical protein